MKNPEQLAQLAELLPWIALATYAAAVAGALIIVGATRLAVHWLERRI